ncbi:peroxiredoxin [Chitinibacteraceae bacterium HSL-7]
MTGGEFDTAQLEDSTYVLYFYPKDNTPGCTTEGNDFRLAHDDFAAAGVKVFGVSRDSLKSHGNFKEKQCFPFDLVSDKDEALCQALDVIKQKKMYGKDVRGIERSTFVVGPDRTIIKAWRGVKVPGHVSEVLEFVRSL